MFAAMVSNSAGVGGRRLKAVQPAFGYVAGLTAASEPYRMRPTPIWRMRVAISSNCAGCAADPMASTNTPRAPATAGS
jgi:hypothetical protein